MTKTVLKWTGNVLTGVLVILIVLAGFSMVQARRNPGSVTFILGYKPMTVLTGSMSPLLAPGDVIFIRRVSPESVKVGDVVTYRQDSSTFITHRVIEVVNEDGAAAFRTKGDANNVEDSSLVHSDQILGALAFKIPKGGYIANFARSPAGFFLFIVLPVVLLIALELKTLWSIADEDEKRAKPEKEEP